MTKRSLLRSCVLLMVFGLAAIPVRASDPCGIYGIVEKVVLEPNDTEPTSVQIWGAFARSDAKMGGGYLPAERGYFYYTCPKGRDTTCLNEWTDLKSLAGKEEFVGFGGRYLATGRLRKADEKPASPDTYPIQMGVLRNGPANVKADVVAALKRK